MATRKVETAVRPIRNSDSARVSKKKSARASGAPVHGDALMLELAKLQSTEPRDDLPALIQYLRDERDGWMRRLIDPPAADTVREVNGHAVTAEYSIATIATEFAGLFDEYLTSSPRHSKAEFSRVVAGIRKRRSELTQVQAETVVKKLHAAGVFIHAKEASRAFMKMLPRMISAAVSASFHAAVAAARDAANKYRPQDLTTGEDAHFRFTPKARSAMRADVLKSLIRDLKLILSELRGDAGAPKGPRPVKSAEALMLILFEEFKAQGHSPSRAARNVSRDPRLKVTLENTSDPLKRIRRVERKVRARGVSRDELRRLAAGQ